MYIAQNVSETRISRWQTGKSRLLEGYYVNKADKSIKISQISDFYSLSFFVSYTIYAARPSTRWHISVEHFPFSLPLCSEKVFFSNQRYFQKIANEV